MHVLVVTTLLFVCLVDPGNSRKDCLGTDNKLSRIRDLSKHYQNLRKRYLDCELVRGNLEITFIDRNFNLSFLKSIREVSGYVLIAMSTASRIPLDNLMLIRGNNLYQNKHALVIVVNEHSILGVGVEQLGLSNLTEILLGSVLIRGNTHLCYVETIIWEDMQDISSKENFTNELEFRSNNCHPCHESCNNHCWGPLPTDCQKLQRTKCAAHCDRYCMRGHEDQCCHSNCASGCFVPRDARMCYACRLFNNSGECVEHCPKPEIYNPTMSMMTPNPDVKYSYGAACVKQCPGHFVVDYNSCVRSCPANKVEVEDRSGRKVCSPCRGICEKTCNGVKKSGRWNYVNAQNVHQFKDCTTISGNLLFRGISFDGDRFHAIPPINSSDLEVFKTIRRITGYLHIESWHKDLKDLSVLENLELIEGRELTNKEYSLILVHLRNVESLNLQSLKKIDAGGVMIRNNDHLCFYNTINWTVILQSDGKLDLAIPSANCSEFSRSFGLQLCDPQCLDNHCWGPGPSQCFQCRHYKRQRTCVESCNLNNSISPEFIDARLCLPCDPECRTVMKNLSCHGAGPHNCTQCLHYRDGNQCLAECPTGVTAENENLIYKYPDADNICRLCHVNCTQGCNGPTLKECNDYIEIHDNRVVIVVAAVLGLLLAVFLLFIGGLAYRRQKNVQHKNTLRKYVERELTQPLTPSGAPPNQAQLHIIKETEIKKGRVLGSGAFGTVFKGSWTPEGETIKIPVAIKVLKEEASPKTNNEVLDEAYVMASVAHPYLVRLLGVCLIPSLQLVTQLMPLGCLLDYTRQHQQRIGSQLLLNWAVQIAKGMSYLEERRLVHRDLAARNVLVKNPEHVAITDFGLTRLLDINQVEYKADGGKLPIKWMALESISERKFTHKSDVWSYGVTVWELMTFGEKPYDGIRAQNLPYLLQKGERLPQPPICTIDVYMVMIKCWIIEPDDRPGFHDLTTEFSRMARDPTRFLVLEADKGGKLLSPRDLLEKDKQDSLEANDSIVKAETVPFTLKLPPEGRRRPRHQNPEQSDARAGVFSSGKQLQRSTSQQSTGRAAAFANGKSNSSLKYTPRSERYLHGPTFPFDNRLEELSSQTAADGENPEYQALSEATSPLPVTRLPSNPFSDTIDGSNKPLPISHSEKIPSSEYVAASVPKEKGTFNNADYINTHQVVLDNPEYHHTNGIARTPIAVNPDYHPVTLAWPADRTNSHISTDV